MIYGRGTAFNIYQILMSQQLPFDYRACSDYEFDFEEGKAASETSLH